MHHRLRGNDRHQGFLDLDLDTYSNSLMKVEISEADHNLEEATGMKAAKIAFLRRDIEESAIQTVHRDEENVEFYRKGRVPYMNETYGHDIGTILWNEVMATLESCYTEEQAQKSRDWWLECGITPPTEQDEIVHGDTSQAW